MSSDDFAVDAARLAERDHVRYCAATLRPLYYQQPWQYQNQRPHLSASANLKRKDAPAKDRVELYGAYAEFKGSTFMQVCQCALEYFQALITCRIKVHQKLGANLVLDCASSYKRNFLNFTRVDFALFLFLCLFRFCRDSIFL